jgi:hypothetical protein
MGNKEEGRAALVESLELRHRLRTLPEDEPKLGLPLNLSSEYSENVDEELIRLEKARASYSESLDMRRRLRDTPNAAFGKEGEKSVLPALSNEMDDSQHHAIQDNLLTSAANNDQENILQGAFKSLLDFSLSLSPQDEAFNELNSLEKARAEHAERLKLRRNQRDGSESSSSVAQVELDSKPEEAVVRQSIPSASEESTKASAESQHLFKHQAGVDGEMLLLEEARLAYSERLEKRRLLRDSESVDVSILSNVTQYRLMAVENEPQAVKLPRAA